MRSYRRLGWSNPRVIALLMTLGTAFLAGATAHAAPQYVLTCDDCHRMPPLDSASGQRVPATGAFKGNHQSHADAGAESCAKCHGPAVLVYDASHRTKSIQVQEGINGSPAGSYSRVFLNQTSVPPASLGTCSNVNCHFQKSTPGWGSASFSAASDCDKCHGDSPSAGHPVSGSKHGNYYGTGTGSCLKCHPDHTVEAKPFAHATSVRNRGISVRFTAAPNAGGSYSGATDDFLPSQTNSFGTCSGLYCHSDGKSLNAPYTSTSPAPSWGGSATLGCNGCHGGPASLGSSIIDTGKHQAHVNNAGALGANYGCVECHAKSVSSDAAISQSAQHVNAFVDYSGAKAGKGSSYAGGVCSATYCHSSGKKGEAGMAASAEPAAPSWSGAPLGCSGCHGARSTAAAGVAFDSVAGEPNYASGAAGSASANSHQKHVKAAGAATCVYCHSGTVDATGTAIVGNHINRAADVASGGGKSFGYPGSKSCSNVSCHSGSGYTAANAVWGSALDCKGCHGTLSSGHTRHIGTAWNALPFYNFTANLSSGSDSDGVTWRNYSFGCANCHPVTASSHLNGAVEVETNQVAGGSVLRNKNSAAALVGGIGLGTVRCSNVYCHQNVTTPQWNQGFTAATRCSGCHENAPGSDAHLAHKVGIHYDNIFSGTTGLLPAAGAVGVNAGHGDPAQSTTIGCNICHYNTVANARNKYNSSCSAASCHGNSTGNNADAAGAARIANLAFHVNGARNVAFAPATIIRSKAQVAASTFASYTGGVAGWNAAGRVYKDGTVNSYDRSKNYLGAGSYAGGNCSNVSCHNGVTVNWVNDFGAAQDCTMCHNR